MVGSAAVPLESQPVQFQASGTLGSLTVGQQAHIARRFGAYGQLRDLAAGGSIIVPDRPILDHYTLVHYSRLDVEVEEYPVKLTKNQAEILFEDAGLLGEGEIVGREVRPYVVVATSDEVTTMRVVMFGGTVVLVEESLYFAAVEATS